MIGAHLTGDVTSVSAPGGVVTLVEGRCFCLSSAAGDITPTMAQGLFVLDVRALSRWELRLNGNSIEGLSVDLKEPYAADFAGRSRPVPGRSDAELTVFRRRRIGRGLSERIEVLNHSTTPAEVTLEVVCDADFAGIFDVKGGRAAASANRRAARIGDAALRFTSDDLANGTEVTITASEAAIIDPGRMTWRRTLNPGERWELCCDVTVAFGGRALEPRFRCGREEADAVPSRRLASWRGVLPDVTSSRADLDSVIARAGEDLGSLRIYDQDHPDVPILAAGAPWYMTLFGRDSLITAWMTLLADGSLAGGVLETLARLQGTDVDDRTEEEPGKILHEVRLDLADGLTLARGDVYYGSVDATPLFVMLLGEARRWGLDDDTLGRLLPHADRALAWIEQFGDRDGDGYVEYQRRTPDGLANQGWKDSWDGIRFANGGYPQPPIALCEVQGYVYAAYVERAHLAAELGDRATCDRYRRKAAELRRRFNEDFWLEERGWYGLALDADKRPVDALASNVGHCLWSEIVDPDRAAIVADRMLAPELFSGWGLRTLATSMAAYNPVSYHNGSVWPHDNAITAAGLARYGFTGHAARVIEAQLDVATRCNGRLPELFAGFARDDFGAPAAYPSSCSPQAWAAASPLLWLRVLLGLDPWAGRNELWLQPHLPDWLEELHVEGISAGGDHLSIHTVGDHIDVQGASRLTVLRKGRPMLAETFDQQGSETERR